jgi:hypothetical protein
MGQYLSVGKAPQPSSSSLSQESLIRQRQIDEPWMTNRATSPKSLAGVLASLTVADIVPEIEAVRPNHLPRRNNRWETLGGCGRSQEVSAVWCSSVLDGSGGLDGEGVEVVGQDRPAGPDPLALVALEATAPQPIVTLMSPSTCSGL